MQMELSHWDHVGANLRRARLLAKKSLRSAAATVHRSATAVHNWEQDPTAIKATDLATLCAFYGVSPDSVLDSAAPLSADALQLAHAYEAMPMDVKRQVRLLWQVFARRGAPDPLQRSSDWMEL